MEITEDQRRLLPRHIYFRHAYNPKGQLVGIGGNALGYTVEMDGEIVADNILPYEAARARWNEFMDLS